MTDKVITSDIEYLNGTSHIFTLGTSKRPWAATIDPHKWFWGLEQYQVVDGLRALMNGEIYNDYFNNDPNKPKSYRVSYQIERIYSYEDKERKDDE